MNRPIMDLYRESNLCRLCLKTDTFHLNIFSKLGTEKQIIKKIQSCLPMKVDLFPQTVCYKCVSTLDVVYEFWKNALNADKTVRRNSSTSADTIANNKQSSHVMLNSNREIRKSKASGDIPRKQSTISNSHTAQPKPYKSTKFASSEESTSEDSDYKKISSNKYTGESKQKRSVALQRMENVKTASRQRTDTYAIKKPYRIESEATVNQLNRISKPTRCSKKLMESTGPNKKTYGVRKPVEKEIVEISTDEKTGDKSDVESYESLCRELPSFRDILSSEAGQILESNETNQRTPQNYRHNLWQRTPDNIWPRGSNSSKEQETESSSSKYEMTVLKTFKRKSLCPLIGSITDEAKSRKLHSETLRMSETKVNSKRGDKKTKYAIHEEKKNMFDIDSAQSDSDYAFDTILKHTAISQINKEKNTNTSSESEMQLVPEGNIIGTTKISDFWKRSFEVEASSTSSKNEVTTKITNSSGSGKYQVQDELFDGLLNSNQFNQTDYLQSKHTTKQSMFDFSSQGSDFQLTPQINAIQRIRERTASKSKKK